MSPHSETARLLGQMGARDRDEALAGKNDLWRVVRHAGRPGGQQERSPIVVELAAALSTDFPEAVRREVLWMLSEIGGDESVGSIAALLKSPELCDDARMALERIPGDESLAALQAGIEAAEDDFKTNLAQSLRRRGVEVPGYPCQKLVPVKTTAVKAIGP